jgi:hypothetical protein
LAPSNWRCKATIDAEPIEAKIRAAEKDGKLRQQSRCQRP